MANDLDSWLASLPDRLEREVEVDWEDAVEEELVEPIRDAAPVGLTGQLRASIRKRRGRRLEWIVEAGGDATTKAIGTRSYREPVVIPVPGDEAGYEATKGIKKGGNAGVVYDYALGREFGNRHAPAQPFFWSTARARFARLQRRAEQIVANALGRL